MKRFPILCSLLILGFLVVTIVTQIGGVLLLIGGLSGFFAFRSGRNWKVPLCALFVYGTGLLVTPWLAKVKGGREALPWRATPEFPVQPRNFAYVLLFRNYVSKEMCQTLRECSLQYRNRFPGEKLDYLDACFPFIDGFPLLPHLSHDSGKQVDLCFGYSCDGRVSQSPSPIGYWIYENPRDGEPAPCGKSWLRWDMEWIQDLNRERRFDQERTKVLVKLLTEHAAVEKLFLEPHLKVRLGLRWDTKVRFQGCHAARHDDHLHVQIY